jgi:hypothetical protein
LAEKLNFDLKNADKIPFIYSYKFPRVGEEYEPSFAIMSFFLYDLNPSLAIASTLGVELILRLSANLNRY